MCMIKLQLIRQHILHALSQVIIELLPRLIEFGRRPSEEKMWIAIVVVEFDRYPAVTSGTVNQRNRRPTAHHRAYAS